MPGDVPSQIFSRTTRLAFIPLDQVRSRKIRAGLDHWTALRGARRFPARAEIDPRKIAGVLTNMVLIKVLEGGKDFLFRIVGDHAGQGYSVQMTNRLLSEVRADLPKASENWQNLLSQIAASGEPLAMRIAAGRDAPEMNYTNAEAVLLPLGKSENEVEHIVCFVEHDRRA